MKLGKKTKLIVYESDEHFIVYDGNERCISYQVQEPEKAHAVIEVTIFDDSRDFGKILGRIIVMHGPYLELKDYYEGRRELDPNWCLM